MGQVWQATDTQLNRQVALKMGSPKVHVGDFASLTLGGGSSMLMPQSMITSMSADAQCCPNLRILPSACRLERHAWHRK